MASRESLVIFSGNFLKTRVTSVDNFSFNLFSVTLYTSQWRPIKSFWVAAERLKYTKDDDISSANLIEIEGFPL